MQLNRIATRTLFVGYYRLDHLDRAPKVRIQALSHQLGNLGCKVQIIDNPLSRGKRQLCAMLDGSLRGIRYAYIEGASSISWPVDLLFMLYLRLKGVRVSFYVRDLHPLFPLFTRVLTVRQRIAYAVWQLTIRASLRLADQVYVPTLAFGKFLPYSRKAPTALPPAMSPDEPDLFDVQSKQILYAGGLSRRYGLQTLVEISSRLSEIDLDLRLVVLGRSDGNTGLEDLPVQVIQGGMDELVKRNHRFRLALLPLEKNEYNRLAFAVKLFDYLSRGLPVVSTDIPAHVRIIERYQVGVAVAESDFVDQVLNLVQEPERCAHYHANIASIRGETWRDRVEQIMRDAVRED